jgi:Tfp pilus assembly protein FimT
LIVIVAAMAAPAFQGPVEDFRLLRSADLVRARWAKARSEAMRSGRTMMFRYQTGLGTYEIAPWQDATDYLESSQLSTTTTPLAAPSAAMAQDPLASAPRTEELGEGVHFFGSSTVSDSRSVTIQMALQGQAAQGWSPPVLFYPDGTSSTARVILRNQRDRYVLVQLRGLSGVAQISDLLSSTELPQ